jgi:hypothetical protein
MLYNKLNGGFPIIFSIFTLPGKYVVLLRIFILAGV